MKKCTLPIDTARSRLLEEEKRREERVKLAIAKGKQTVLPTQTKSIKLSKFEHRSDEGPLVVFAEELAYPFGNFGNYQAVRKYQSCNDIGKDYSKVKRKSKGKYGQTKSWQMSNEEIEDKPNSLGEKPSIESQESNYDKSQTQFRLPKLKSGPTATDIEDASAKLEFWGKNTELPKLPAQEYIDNFRRDAADFERNLIGIGRGNPERRLLKGKPRELGVLPRIDERSSLLTTNTDKLLAKDEHFRLPKLQQKREDCFIESSSKKKRKTRNNGEMKKQEYRRSMSHSERKAVAQKEQAKWCKMTFQSNAYI